MRDGYYSSRELVETVGCSRKALRVYQRHGLINPTRRTGNRRYDSEAFHRLRLICALRDLGMPVPDIKDLLDVYEGDAPKAGPVAARLAAEVNSLVRTVTDRIEHFTRVRQQLIEARETLFQCSSCEKPVASCEECAEIGRLDPTTRVLLAGRGTGPTPSNGHAQDLS